MEEHAKDARAHAQDIYNYTNGANIPSCLDEYNNYMNLWAEATVSAMDNIISGDYEGAVDDLGASAEWIGKANDAIQNLLNSNNLNG
jgi:hypothetical protein